MIFSKDQAQALQFLNLNCYLPKDNTEEICYLFEENEVINENPSLNQDLDKQEELNLDEFKNLVKNNNSKPKPKDNFNLENKDNNKSSPEKLTEKKLILESKIDDDVFYNFKTTIISYKNIALFLPPLIFKGDNIYKIYYYKKEIEIWEIIFNKCDLKELAEKFVAVANTNFPAPENKEIPENFKADLAVIFADNEVRNLSDKLNIPSIKCIHPALATEIYEYKKLLWKEQFQKIAQTIKAVLQN